jgi:hypothetical protein
MTRAVPKRARKLSDDDVREIRRNPIPVTALAKYYGINQKVILVIRKGETYKHVRDEP